MPTCRICQHTFKSLKFQTEHIDICTRCVNTLNESPEPAKNAEARFAEKLARGMLRNAEHDLKSDEEWKRRKAQQTLANIDAAVAAKLHDWITQLLAKSSNSTRDFKIMRAHRRALLRMEGRSDYRDRNWKEVAQRIRRRDGFKCMECGATNTTLDVHHIIYLSHHGTNQQNNLITLCRKCHETEHDRLFDWPESQDPESASPIQPRHNGQAQQSEPPLTVRSSTLLPVPESAHQFQALLTPVDDNDAAVEKQNAETLPTEQLPDASQSSTEANAPAANGNRQSLDDGLAQTGGGPAVGDRVPVGAASLGGNEAGGMQSVEQSALGTLSDWGKARTQKSPAAPVAVPGTAETSPKSTIDIYQGIKVADMGNGSVSTSAQALCRQVNDRQPSGPAFNSPTASWVQEPAVTALNSRPPNWGVMIGGIIFWVAVALLVINIL
ncbi:HNH endonuclease [Pseudomonas sp. SA3-5]|uniref:HNH endonuclease n=1 Tax=Pseudomonas aestuarii TaxID=3018340 RepID=A0ABT4XG26_9PSED|nr:HNH endonuclease [Pseudomonas aestuarii]MDA7087121.1 HNH endonuclease [Pseudomonas aestuarii]